MPKVSSTQEVRERKREQNRIAQQTYRRNQKRRILALEAAIKQSSGPVSVTSYMNNGGGSCPSDWEFDGANGDFGSTMNFDEMVFPSPPVEPNDPIREKSNFDETFFLDENPGDFIPSITSSPRSDLCPSALHRAISSDNIPMIQLLLGGGADTRRRDCDGLTPLHIAVKDGKQEVVKLLLEKGLDPNVKDSVGRTVLFQAVEDGNEAMMKVLLDASVDVNCADMRGNVALHVAVERGSLPLASLLLSYGADVNA